jgi:hypothetical protein
LIHRAVIKEIDIWIVAVDFNDFGNESASWPAFDMDNDVQ